MTSPTTTDKTSQCVHQRFEQQARRTPDAPAVRFENDLLSFSELNSRANRLADVLRAADVGPEVPVALFVERSLDLAVALLGILKAGGAYVPLDTDHPSQRQAFILEDCQPAAIVTKRHLRFRALADTTRLIYIEESGSAAEQGSSDNPHSAVGLHNLAYILYTSGTTGRPKGVAVEHRQLMNYLEAAADTYHLSTSASYAMAQTIAVDTCITTLYTPLVTGGTLHLLSRERSLDPDALAEYGRQYRIDCLKIAPSHLSVLLDSPGAADCLPQQHLVLGGEPPSWKLIERVRALRPACAIINEYGPTETTVGVIAARLNKGNTDRTTTTPPIGIPIGGNQAYLLDQHLRPVSDGTEGELFIGGDQLARGYLGQSEPTADAFIPDPLTAVPGARLYRTGDLARRLPDGTLEYVGRVDRQTKVRGFRIEPGEIEKVLGEHAAVRQAVVEAYAEPSGRKRLAAYVVLEPSVTVTAARLLRYLWQRLPDPMVPSAVIFLDVLPLLPQGKLDRKSLPLPQDRRATPADKLTTPRNTTEAKLLDIWQDVLGVAPIGIEEDFFKLGGDSLLASTLVMQLRRSFGRDVSLATLFAVPTVEGLAKALAEKPNAEAEEAWLPIAPTVHGKDSPLSFAQERIWFIHQTNPETLCYSYGVKFCFEGALSITSLEKSLSEEVRRHEIYRTSFHDTETGPIQRVHPPWTVQLPHVDLSNCPEETRELEARRRLDAVLKQRFDFTEPPLVRWILFRLDAHTHWLLHVENHLVHDGWASDLFFQEMLDLYNAFSRGQPSPLLDPPLQYADFARWERDWINGPEAARQRDFWQRTLAGCQSTLSLPATRKRPARPTYRGARHDIELDDALWHRLCALGRHERATPFMVMLTAFYALISHYTGESDINLGTGVANRRRPEVAGVLGMFINNLVLRLDLSGNPSFATLMARVREVTLAAFANQELPFNAVVKTVASEQRDISANPLYQVMFSFHDTPMPDLSVPDLRVTMEPSLDTSTAKFDLNVIVYPALVRDVEVNLPATDRPTWMIWEYSSELFDEATIERMASHFIHLLDRATANPALTLSQMSPLAACEREQLLIDWNVSSVNWPSARTVHGLFEAQAERTPDAIAVVFRDQRLTYRELNSRANRLAHALQELGVAANTTVALLLERSPEVLAAMLAVLKTGAAYLSLDPEYPKARVQFILEDTRASAMLTLSDSGAQLPAKGCPVFELDRFDWDSPKHAESNPDTATSPEDLAYILYTSGSTGQPKGVEICHSGIVSLVFGLDCVVLDNQQTLLQLAPLAFDASTFEIWGALLHGGRCVLFDERMPTAASLERAIRTHRITTLFLTTALFNILIDESVEALGNVAQLLTGGEAASPEHVKKALRHLQNTRLINCYGPTECTTFTTCYPVSRDLSDENLTIPIGRSVCGRRVYILDSHRNPVPIGVAGELYIGGEGLARGYRNQPALTEEHFVLDPFGNEPNGRLYRTGDRARYLADGNIEFLGRLDDQVKIRGHRIEPGEIEAVLLRHPRIRAAAVAVDETSPSDKRLVAYLVAASKSAPSIQTLREFLRQQLPSYLHPAEFVMMETLPMTSSGKVDRKSLPTSFGARADAVTRVVPPGNPIEQVLADIWSEVLNIDQVGIHDNFFELGGHSLVATQVISRIKKRLAVEISIRAIFDFPTVAQLANSEALVGLAE
jgi:amino acid adenylation domain-containing protein